MGIEEPVIGRNVTINHRLPCCIYTGRRGDDVMDKSIDKYIECETLKHALKSYVLMRGKSVILMFGQISMSTK